MILMCVFDTLSDSNEVLADIYDAYEANMQQLLQAKDQAGPEMFFRYLSVLLNSCRGLFEGVHQTQRFMWLLYDRFLAKSSCLRQLLEVHLCARPVLLEEDTSINLLGKFELSRSILKLMQEVTMDRDSRMCFESRNKQPHVLSFFALKVTYSCLGILRQLDITQDCDQMSVDKAKSILKMSLRICLQLGRHSELMSRKLLEQMPALKDTFQEMLSSLMQGLMMLVQRPDEVKYETQKLRYEFLSLIMSKHFGFVLRPADNFATAQYCLGMVQRGTESSTNLCFLLSHECIDYFYTYTVKGSKFYRESLVHVIHQPVITATFKHLMKVSLRALMRREEAHMNRRIQSLLAIVGMYMHSSPIALQIMQASDGKENQMSQENAATTVVYQACREVAAESTGRVMQANAAAHQQQVSAGLLELLVK